MARSIYLDRETISAEQIILERNPDFNFSNLYKDAVLKAANKEVEINIDKKKSKLLEIKKQIGYLNADYKVLEEEVKNIELKQMKEKEDELRMEQEQEKIQLEKELSMYMKYFALTRSDALNFKSQWIDARDNGRATSWIDFGISQGFNFDKELWEANYGIKKNKK